MSAQYASRLALKELTDGELTKEVGREFQSFTMRAANAFLLILDSARAFFNFHWCPLVMLPVALSKKISGWMLMPAWKIWKVRIMSPLRRR